MRIYKDLIVNEKKNFLESLNESPVDFALTTLLVSISSVVRDVYSKHNIKNYEEFIEANALSDFFDYMFKLTVEQTSHLTSIELKKENLNLVEQKIINKDLTFIETEDKTAWNELIRKSKEKIINSYSRDFKMLIGFGSWKQEKEAAEKTHDQLKVAKYALFHEKADELISEAFLKSYKCYVEKEIADIKLFDDKIYAFRMKDNLEDMIESGVLFELTTYKIRKKGMTVNGERMEFVPDGDGLPFKGTITLHNGPSSLQCFADHDYSLFFDKESAKKYSEEKIMKLKKVLKNAESVRF